MRGRRAIFAAAVFLVAAGQAVAQQNDGLGVTLADSLIKPKGAFVNVVTPDGPAARAGVLSGDVVTVADGKPVANAADLERILARHVKGDVVTLHIVRFGTTQQDLTVALAAASAPVAARVQATASTPEWRAIPTPATKPSTMRWVRFVDPNEHAFTIDVPAGWRVTGGSRRMSTVEIRSGVQAISPDGAIDLFYGDLGIPIFTVPSPLLARAGLRQGMTYNPGYGQQLLIMPYYNGEAFAAQWGGRRVARDCAGVSRVGARPRPDMSRGIDQVYAAYGIRTSILAGEAQFGCTLRGAPAVGYVFAATELVRSQMSTLWDVKSALGFVAARPRAAAAYALLGRMVASFAIDPGWAARQQQTAAQTSRAVAQTNQVVSNAIIQNGRTLAATSDMIVKGGQARSNATFNAIEGYDENAVRGTSTYVNPETGTAKTLDNGYAHQYINNSGQVLGTNSEKVPGPGWTEMQRVPPGQ